MRTHILPNPNVLVAVSKGIWAVKVFKLYLILIDKTTFLEQQHHLSFVSVKIKQPVAITLVNYH